MLLVILNLHQNLHLKPHIVFIWVYISMFTSLQNDSVMFIVHVQIGITSSDVLTATILFIRAFLVQGQSYLGWKLEVP